MKKLLFYTFAFVIVLSASVLVLELTARLLFEDTAYVVTPLSEFEHDPLLGWKGILNYQGVSRLSKAKIKINSLGFRDPDWNQVLQRAKEAGIPKILVLGDSVTYGYEIEQYERFTEQLQRLYKNRDQNVITPLPRAFLGSGPIRNLGPLKSCRHPENLRPRLSGRLATSADPACNR